MISKQTARKMYNYYTERIDQLIQAQTALTAGGVKSYTIGDRQITKFDLSRLSAELDDAVNKQAYYDAILHNRPTRAICSIIPNDK
ncbi:MAG: hypothetical protein NC299_08895 [Lachnospiraceae bacterium]|nr:hypothetical protein [Lachnospiraceae bacterium]